MTSYNCPKGVMKWTHRMMILSVILAFIGIVLLPYGIMTNNVKLAYTGIGLLGLYCLIMIFAALNAYMKKCYKTANLIIFGYPFA